MIDSVKDFFNFNKRQERGIFVLSLILLLVILLNYFAPSLAPDPPKHMVENVKYLKLVKLQAIKEPKKYKRFTNAKIKTYTALVKVEPKSLFDPNSISSHDLVLIGLPEKIANNIQKYRNSGGRFYKKEDLKKIYGMTEGIYSDLEPYISIKAKKYVKSNSDFQTSEVTSAEIKKTHNKEWVSASKAVIQLGINSADSVQLLSVRGIGPYYAGEIVNYRNRLGGYNDIEQLNGLYKMDTSKYIKMTKQLFLDTIPLTKMNINTAEFKAILRHPYIDYETTKYIVNKRNRLGKYAALYQLKDSVHMLDDLYDKLLPYLSVD